MQPEKIDNSRMGNIRHIHMVGIGGSGMGGIAEVLLNLGYLVSGSDIHENRVIERLRGLGATIAIGHQRENLKGADVVVTSSAVNESNPEVSAARAERIPVVPRAEMLAELMRFRQGIAIAGTHGKTTTTSMAASVLAGGGLDPTFVIGGRLNSAGTNARLGSGEYLVAEADESDASFLYLQPMMAVVTNIDADHMATYDGDFNKLKHSFVEFLHHIPFYGLAIICIDDPVVREILPLISRRVVTYGFHSEDADYRGLDLIADGINSHYRVERPNGEALQITLPMPGIHNALNALAAVALATELGVDDTAIVSSLKEFAGIDRRFQIHCEIKTDKGDITLVDDYGHHPREVAATLNAVRAAWPERRIVVAFQPHRYSRTRDLFEDFTEVLCGCDQLLLLEIYPAGEEAIQGADGRTLCRSIRLRGLVDPIFVPTAADLANTLAELVAPGDVIITLGAGDIGTTPKVIAKMLEQRWRT